MNINGPSVPQPVPEALSCPMQQDRTLNLLVKIRYSLNLRWCSLSIRWCNFVLCDRESITGHIVGRFAPALHLQQPCIAQHAQFRARLQGVTSGKLPIAPLHGFVFISLFHFAVSDVSTIDPQLLTHYAPRNCLIRLTFVQLRTIMHHALSLRSAMSLPPASDQGNT